MHVLVVEDDEKTAQWLRLYLERDGLRVSAVTDGRQALARMDADPPDLVLIDVMIPGLNGFDTCRAIRSSSRIPVILVTARTAEDDRLRGFEAGADDYVTKPFSPREVVARVRAVLRRSSTTSEVVDRVISVGHATLRSYALTLEYDGQSIRLTPVEARLLGVMMGTVGRSWTRAQLVARVFGDDYDGNERTIDAHIKNLRKKLDMLPETPDRLRIETTHGLGYTLTCEA